MAQLKFKYDSQIKTSDDARPGLVSIHTVFLLSTVLILSTGCIPNNSTPIPKKNTTSTTSRTSSGSSKTATATDGASGVCLAYALGDPTRELCKSCYTSVLAQKCPGFTTLSSCPDTSLVSKFNNFVAQCVSSAQLSNLSCPSVLSCGTGMVQSPITCGCVPSSNGTVDSGQVDSGPPVLFPVWPSNTVAPELTDALFSAALAVNPVGIIAQPRGGRSLSSVNISNPNYGCYQGTTSINNGSNASYFTSPPSAPALNGLSGRFENQFSLETTGYREYCFGPNCGTREGFWLRPAATGAALQSMNTTHFGQGIAATLAGAPAFPTVIPTTVPGSVVTPHANFVNGASEFHAYMSTATGGLIAKEIVSGFTSNRGLKITLAAPGVTSFKGGLYNLYMNLLVFDKWEGQKDSSAPHQIVVQMTPYVAGVAQTSIDVFKESFSNNPSYQQSFTGAPVNTSAANFYDPDVDTTIPGWSTAVADIAEEYDNAYNLNIPISISTDVNQIDFLIYAKNTYSFPAGAADPLNVIEQSFGFSRIGFTPIPTCGVKYHVSDGGVASADYCMRFNLTTSCSPMVTDSPCTTIAAPVSSNEGAGFFEQQNSQASCP